MPHEYRAMLENASMLPRSAWWWFGAVLVATFVSVAWAFKRQRSSRKPSNAGQQKANREKRRTRRRK